MRYTLRAATLLAAAALAACQDATAPLPAGATLFTPPENFAAWWSMVEECSGQTRPMGQVAWYSVPGSAFNDAKGEQVIGLYRNGPDEVVLPLARLKEGPVVRHEMLHAILDSHSDILHPHDYFMRRCRGVVACGSRCQASPDAPAYATSTPIVEPTAIQIALMVDSVISRRQYAWGTYLPVVVTAKNPAPNAVYVRLPKSGAKPATFSASFMWRNQYGSTEFATDADSLDGYFAAGEIKRFVFDAFLRPTDPLGNWTVGGSYGGRPIQNRAVRVTP